MPPHFHRDRVINLLCSLVFSAFAIADEPSSTSPETPLLETVVQHFIEARLQEQGLRGEIEVQHLMTQPPCDNPEPFIAANTTRLLGRFTVGIRCQGAASRYLSAKVSISSDYLVARRNIARGELITTDALEARVGKLESLPRNTVTDAKAVLGLQAIRAITANNPLQMDQLRAMPSVLKGARVQILIKGVGFQISREATALEDGAFGNEIRVRTDNAETLRARVIAPNQLQLLQ